MEEEFSNKLTPEQAELIAVLFEECAEVVQICGKILRHGLYSAHPRDLSRTNDMLLSDEVGHVFAAVEMLASIEVFSRRAVAQSKLRKLKNIQPFLHFHVVKKHLIEAAEGALKLFVGTLS